MSSSFNRETRQDSQGLSLSSGAQYATDTGDPSIIRSTFSKMSSSDDSLASPFFTRLQIYSTQVPKAYISPICGAGAGLASGVVTCPLDVIKTKLQAQGGFSPRRGVGMSTRSPVLYKGIFGTARVILQEDGFRGLYRGLGPMLMGYLPTWAVYLTVYENTRDYYYDASGSWWLARCYSSLTAGACSTVLTNPIWVIKTRLMTQSTSRSTEGTRAPWHYNSTFDAAKKMYANEGVRSFYAGLTPALLGLTHVAIQFPLYEYFKMRFTGFGMGEHPSDDSGSHWVGITAATFLSKICASTATYPHEVLRTRLQTRQRSRQFTTTDGSYTSTKATGTVGTFRAILHEEGWTAFYAGIGTNLVRAVPAAMVTMLTYEWLQKVIHNFQDAGEELKRKRSETAAAT